MLGIEVEFTRGVLFVRLKGELTKDTKEKLIEIEKLKNQIGIYNIVINLDNIVRIDQEGLNSINHFKETINGGSILVCNVPTFLEKGVSDKILIKKIKNELIALNLINI